MIQTSQIISLLLKARKEKRYVFVCGNGGSACNAEHLAEDLLSRGVRAIALTNIGNITAIANDYKYEDVFANQLKVLANKGDILITLSCSGKSQNILKAQVIAQIYEMKIIAFPTNNDTNMITPLTEIEHAKLIHDIYLVL